MSPPGGGDCGADPLLNGGKRGAVMPGYFLVQPTRVNDNRTGPADTEVHGVGQIEKTGAICLEAHTIQGVINQNDTALQFMLSLLGMY